MVLQLSFKRQSPVPDGDHSGKSYIEAFAGLQSDRVPSERKGSILLTHGRRSKARRRHLVFRRSLCQQVHPEQRRLAPALDFPAIRRSQSQQGAGFRGKLRGEPFGTELQLQTCFPLFKNLIWDIQQLGNLHEVVYTVAVDSVDVVAGETADELVRRHPDAGERATAMQGWWYLP